MVVAVSRAGAIAMLREELLKIASDERSLCLVAAERGIFCQGFSRYTDSELRARLASDAVLLREKSREEIEKLANLWMLNRQEALELPLSCDVEREEKDLCGGWDVFGDKVIERFCREILQVDLVINR